MRNQSITTVKREITLAELMYLLMMQCKQFGRQIRRYLSYYFQPRMERVKASCRDISYQQCMQRYKVFLDGGDGDIVSLSNAQVIKASIVTMAAVILLAIL